MPSRTNTNSVSDDARIIALKEHTVQTWAEIARSFPGRTKGSIQVRYARTLSKNTASRRAALAAPAPAPAPAAAAAAPAPTPAAAPAIPPPPPPQPAAASSSSSAPASAAGGRKRKRTATTTAAADEPAPAPKRARQTRTAAHAAAAAAEPEAAAAATTTTEEAPPASTAPAAPPTQQPAAASARPHRPAKGPSSKKTRPTRSDNAPSTHGGPSQQAGSGRPLTRAARRAAGILLPGEVVREGDGIVVPARAGRATKWLDTSFFSDYSKFSGGDSWGAARWEGFTGKYLRKGEKKDFGAGVLGVPRDLPL